jgi:hypothetical protein
MIAAISQTSSLHRGSTAPVGKGGWAGFGIAGVLALGCVLGIPSGCSRAADETTAASRTVVEPAPSTSAAGTLLGNAPVQRYANSANSGEAAVSGTSTLHDWTVKSTKIEGIAEFSGELKSVSNKPVTLQSIYLTIPVDSLKSTEGSGMDDTMYDSLHLKKFPAITYKLTKATLTSAPTKDGSPYHFDTTGLVTVSGNAHPVSLDLAVLPVAGGKLTITTAVAFKMTDFSVAPPTAMLGMIKSGDAITVKVTWQLSQQP